ncbi:MAG: Crp/Fnr family transcriptional regulator [Planctomycetes bacterium]|nr:Crp/Fnr family transcriptional regulator [Planctomycetota bacterium]
MLHSSLPLLKQISIFSNLSDAALEQIAAISENVHFTTDELIFEEGEEAEALYMIKSGQVRIEQKYRDGRKKTLALLSDNSFFGEMAIITKEQRCASASAAVDSELICVEKSAFIGCLRSNAEACYGILQIMCERLQNADTEISNLTFRNLPGRIVYKLFELAEQFGIPDENGTMIRLSITHYDLADMVGTNRESVSKYISKFKKEGSISSHNKNITILDRKKLLSWT